tara:strand:- start:122 stop:403 length:282 start_codon:yes stop_codon:yes gene_type:complete
MAKKKKKGSSTKSKMISKMAGKFAGPQSHYPPAVARDVSKRGQTTDYSSRPSLANANATASSAGKSQFVYNRKLYNTGSGRGASPTLVRKLTV